MDKVRMGIIGVGNMGSGHARYLMDGDIKGCELTAVCDIDPERLKWAKETFEDKLALFSDYKEMYKSGKIDAVIVAVPHYDHPQLIIDAFEAGLHAICEKPAGVYTNQVIPMNEAAKRTGKVFSMMFNQRTNPCYQKLRELVQTGALGQIQRTNWIITNWYRTQSYYNSGGWRATWGGEGGGVLINQCPHNIDLWQWTCGMPTRVRAFCQNGKWHDIEVEDNVTCYVEYENGATGVFITTTGEAPGTNRFEVCGELGKVVIEGTTLTFTKNAESAIEFSKNNPNGFGSPKREVETFEFPDSGPQHRGITQNFVNAILHGEALLCPGTEGINGLTLSNAMHLSSWLDDWVDLPINGDLYYEKLQEKIKTSTYKKEVKKIVMDTEGTY